MELRQYQVKAIGDTRAALSINRAVCLALAPGAGKTVIFAELVSRFIRNDPTKRALVIAHRRELIQQAAAKLANCGVDAGVILAGVKPDTSRRVQVASVQTLARRDLPHADLLIVDECHHAVSDSYRAILGAYPEALILGVSGTPFRLDGQGLGEVFGSIVAPTSVRALCDAGYLLEPHILAPPGPDMRGVRTNAGDYSSSGAAEKMKPLTGDIVQHWLKYANDRRTVAFSVNVEHSELITEQFIAAGVAAAHCDGSVSHAERQDILDRLRAGELRVVSNCALWGEGVDMPELEVAILARPTKSLCLHLQQIGRIMRPAPGKERPLVLDHAGNHHVHGRVTDEMAYSLDAKVKRAAPSHTTCKNCYAILPLGTLVCPQCQTVLAPPDREPPSPPEVDTDTDLVEFTADEKRDFYRDCVAQASSEGYKLGFARHRFKERFGVWPRGVAEIDETYECPGHEYDTRQYGVVCSYCLRKKAVIEFRERNDATRAVRERGTLGHAPTLGWED